MSDQVDFRGRPRVQTVNDQASMTVQSDAHEADIKVILKKYGVTGMLTHLNQVEAMYADVSSFGDFADVMRHAKAAEVEFMKLPSKIRERFNHDVATWLDTSHDPEKRASYFAQYDEGPKPEPVVVDPPGDGPGDAS